MPFTPNEPWRDNERYRNRFGKGHRPHAGVVPYRDEYDEYDFHYGSQFGRSGPMEEGYGHRHGHHQPFDHGQGEGLHRGKGPKGYTRSDDRIREDVCDCLCEDSYIDASDIEVQVENGEVSLSGTVDSRGTKRRAEDVVERVIGVKDVQNSLRIKEEASAGLSSKSADKGMRPQ